MVMLGMVRFDFAEVKMENHGLFAQVGSKVILEGIVDREPDVRSTHTQLYIDVGDTVVLALADRYTDVEYGDVVRVTGVLTMPESFTTDELRVFNYPAFLLAKGVTHTIPFADVEVVRSDEGSAIVSALLIFKHSFMKKVEEFIPSPESGLGEGLLLGLKRALGDNIEDAFRRTGIIHIVVLSGYNVMIVAEAIMRLLAVFFSIRARMIIGIITISLFALLVGMGATVIRASVMAGLVLIARAIGRPYAILRALMLAGVAMLLINPYLLVYDPGFQLSFMATLGLILLAPHLEKLFLHAPTKLQIREFLTATISTQIFVLPLLLYLIGTFSIVSVLVNMLVLPSVPFAMLFVFLAGMIGFVSNIFGLLIGYIAYGFLKYIITIALWFGTLPFAAMHVPVFPFWLVILSYSLLGYFIYKLNNRSSEVSKNKNKYDIKNKKSQKEIQEKLAYLDNWVIEDIEDVKTRLKNNK